ncbi:hypothetical protein D3C78_1248490 [compost metagenome]
MERITDANQHRFVHAQSLDRGSQLRKRTAPSSLIGAADGNHHHHGCRCGHSLGKQAGLNIAGGSSAHIKDSGDGGVRQGLPVDILRQLPLPGMTSDETYRLGMVAMGQGHA